MISMCNFLFLIDLDGSEHREGFVEGFTKKYSVHRLVYYELFADMYNAITREKRLKKWRRAWKIRLIEEKNPYWDDLWQQILG